MAMAAVRLSARRLTGRQPQAILRSTFENEQGLLNRGGSPSHALRRFTSSEASAANGPKISTKHPCVSRDERLRTLKQKKEEIYDLLHEIQMDKSVPRTTRMFDRRLLQHLSARIDRRPSDVGWRKYRQERAIFFCLGHSAAVMAGLYLSQKWSSYFELNKQVQEAAGSNNKASVSCAEPNIEE